MKCTRSGCTGSYGPEGYCDVCGLKAPDSVVPAQSQAPAASVASAASVGSGSYGTAWSGSGSGSIRTGRSSRASRRGQLGAGLIEMPRVPLRDPATVVMADPKVSESRRFCGNCEKPVGRSRDGNPGLDEGFCPHCRSQFSFLPKLKAGDVVNNRYELIGCLAYGGLGWIYLARDNNIGDEVAERWVVLKGLINTSDPDAMAAAVTERRFLVEVDHPNIVQIYDFVQHPDPDDGKPISYIVMEYVGGQSLRDLLLSRRGPSGRPEPMPLAQVLAYGLEILPALGYLHERGLLFCDFKPDNVIHAEEQLKLIDLGAVRRADDHHSAVYGTPGYQAPEVATVGPSIASDIYTIGRSLAVLSFDFTGFSTKYAERLPEPSEVPLLAEQDAYYRLLKRATDPDPNRRFESAADMAEQLYGVMRAVLSAEDGVPRPAPSTLFTPERRAFGASAGDATGAVAGEALPSASSVIPAIPLPTVDSADPAASHLATIGMLDPESLMAALSVVPVRTTEVRLRLVRAHLEHGDPAAASGELAALASFDPYDWRIEWYGALAALAAGDVDKAHAAFDAVCQAVPGEPAAHLGLALATELKGDQASAGTYYQRVWRTDRGFVSAAFGLARIFFAAGDRKSAVTVLDEVPETSSYYLAAQVAAVRARLGTAPAALAETDLLDASSRLERLELDVERQARLSVETMHQALQWVLGGNQAANGRVLGHELSERELRFGLERSYRRLAKLSRDRRTRVALVDRANQVRPRTML